MFAEETGENITFDIEYRTKLFKEETIKRFIQYYKKIVAHALQDPRQQIHEIEIISNEEKEKILFEFNDTAAHYPGDKTIHQLFAEQAKKTPDHIAAVGKGKPVDSRQYAVGKKKIKDKIKNNKKIKDKEEQMGAVDVEGTHESPGQSAMQLTYRELNERTAHLARYLQSKGAEPGTIIAIKMERSVKLIIALLGILKTGAAYLPIDTTYPEERIDYILADSSATILLVENKTATKPENQNSINRNPRKKTNILNIDRLKYEYHREIENQAR
ncbi:MAG: AMP-binding protein, partial [bacterium]|nr:AMP-binding protein [bacterium]